MDDIVPELYKNIKAEFDGLVSSDKEIQTVFSGSSNMSMADVSILARRIGGYAAKSLIDHFSSETLPDGILYWNIMQRTIIPIMQEVDLLVNRVGDIVISQMYLSQNIGIKAIRTEFPRERVVAMMNMLSNLTEDEDG